MASSMTGISSSEYPPENQIAEQAIDDFLLSASKRQGPWEPFKRLQAQSGMYYSHRKKMWFISSFNANEQILKSPIALLEIDKRMDAIHAQWREHPSISKLQEYIAFVDNEQHKKIRVPLNPPFTPKMMEKLRPAIRKKAEALVDTFVALGGGSFPDQLSYPLAEHTLAEIFDFDLSKMPDARELVNDMQLAFEIDVSDESLEKADRASILFKNFWHDEYQRVTANPEGNNIFTRLLKNPSYSTEEVATSAEALFSGGFDSVAVTMATGMWFLLENPEQMEKIRSNPELLKQYPAEVMRMSATIPMTLRVAVDEMSIDGNNIKKGDLLGVMLGAANRDPAIFSDPHRFDITRPEVNNLAFSHGVHRCLGRWLARIEIYELTKALFEKTETIDIEGKALFRNRQSVIGVEQLYIKVT